MKKIFFAVFLIVCLVTFIEITSTYSLFETNNDIVVNEDIGKWIIKVNNNLASENVSFVVDNFVVTASSDVASGKFAPGEEGYFDIEIDPNGTDTSIRYDLYIDDEKLSNTELLINSVTEVNGKPLILSDKNVYTGIISLDDIKMGVTHTIRVNIIWHNNEDNNYTDAIWGLDGNDIPVPVDVHLIQYLGEDINVYEG